MIPAAFDYVRATSVDEAIELLGESGDDAKILAGGHSLLPLMKLRLATPSVLVDVGRLSDLNYIRIHEDHVAVGALTRHHDVERSTLLASECPLLPAAVRHVGDPQVRHRGTIGGSVCHSDPAADIPAVLLALGASLVVCGRAGTRHISVDGFFTGFLETSMAADEMLIEIQVPRVPNFGWSFQKFNLRAQDWAIVGVAAVRGNGYTRVGLVNMGQTPVRATAVEQALDAGASVLEASQLADAGVDPPADLHASPDYRRHLARVLVRRALEDAGSGGATSQNTGISE